jgi:hypothetical protein
MPRCCGGGCSCKIQAGTRVSITGVGSSNDPFVIAADSALAVVDNSVFDLTLVGSGTTASPWSLQVGFASTARLRDIPDVNALAPTNSQVLGWDSATSKWTPRAPTTAASGSVQHDTSLAGDGSAGSPLQVNEAANGFIETSSGLKITSAGINQMVRRFATSGDRTAASPAPAINTLSALDTAPGQVDYWTGSQWLPIKSTVAIDAAGAELLALSGSYANTMPVTMLTRNFTGTTSADGTLTLIPNSLISARAGVLSVTVVVTGVQPYTYSIVPNTTQIDMVARNVTGGAVLANTAISGQYTAYVY